MTRLTLALAGAALLSLSLAAPVARADVIAAVDAVDVSSETFALFVRSKLRKEPGELTDEERHAALDEMTDLVLLTRAAEKAGIPDEPATAAQLELQRMSVLAQTAVQKHLRENPVTEEMLRAEYDARSGPEHEYRARHILLEDRASAVALIEELEAGAEFAKLAEERSTGPTASNGGDLGWFSADQMVKPFSDAVKALDTGRYTTEPVETRFGWHVILKEEQRELPPRSFEQMRAELQRTLQQRTLDELLAGLREAAGVAE